MREWVNDRVRNYAPELVDRYRHRLGVFIADKMKEWNETELIEKLELNIGADLQYIRINGAVVGGLVGLIIHAISIYL
jgi:Predicted membrane protein